MENVRVDGDEVEMHEVKLVVNIEGHIQGLTMVRPDARNTLLRADQPASWTSMHSGRPLAVLGTIGI